MGLWEVLGVVGLGCGVWGMLGVLGYCRCGVCEYGLWGVADNQPEQVLGRRCVGSQPEQLWGEDEKSIREFFTKSHRTP